MSQMTLEEARNLLNLFSHSSIDDAEKRHQLLSSITDDDDEQAKLDEALEVVKNQTNHDDTDWSDLFGGGGSFIRRDNDVYKAFKTLGMEITSDLAKVKSVYRKLAMKFHPDRNPDNPKADKMFAEINKAWDTIEKHLKHNPKMPKGKTEQGVTIPDDIEDIYYYIFSKLGVINNQRNRNTLRTFSAGITEAMRVLVNDGFEFKTEPDSATSLDLVNGIVKSDSYTVRDLQTLYFMFYREEEFGKPLYKCDSNGYGPFEILEAVYEHLEACFTTKDHPDAILRTKGPEHLVKGILARAVNKAKREAPGIKAKVKEKSSELFSKLKDKLDL